MVVVPLKLSIATSHLHHKSRHERCVSKETNNHVNDSYRVARHRLSLAVISSTAAAGSERRQVGTAWRFVQRRLLSTALHRKVNSCWFRTPMAACPSAFRLGGRRCGSLPRHAGSPGRHRGYPQGTGSPEAVTRLRLPHNVACGFPALRSSTTDSQHSECLQLSVGQPQAWSLQRVTGLDLLESLPGDFAFATTTAEHLAPIALHRSYDALERPEVACYSVVRKVSSETTVEVLHLLPHRQVSHPSHQVPKVSERPVDPRLFGP
jgi:hypothetical protein